MTRSSAVIDAPVAAGVLMAESLRAGNFYREVSAFNAEGNLVCGWCSSAKEKLSPSTTSWGYSMFPERRQSKKMGAVP